jgi:hypothetical protein
VTQLQHAHPEIFSEAQSSVPTFTANDKYYKTEGARTVGTVLKTYRT